jgi:hypothetical protein
MVRNGPFSRVLVIPPQKARHERRARDPRAGVTSRVSAAVTRATNVMNPPLPNPMTA